jgi:hypothetical protein
MSDARHGEAGRPGSVAKLGENVPADGQILPNVVARAGSRGFAGSYGTGWPGSSGWLTSIDVAFRK